MILFMMILSDFAYSQTIELGSRHSIKGRYSRGKGRLKGVVKNEVGAFIKNALVVLTHNDSVTKFVTKTNKKGVWAFIGLGTGKYTINISLKGYQRFVEVKSVLQLRSNPKVICILKKKEKPGKDEFRIQFRQISHKVGSFIGLNEKVYTLFDYNIPKAYNDGVYIWVVPIVGKVAAGKVFKHMWASAILKDSERSKLITKKQGTLTRYFSIKNGTTKVGKIAIVIMDKSRKKVLAKYSHWVNYRTLPRI